MSTPGIDPSNRPSWQPAIPGELKPKKNESESVSPTVAPRDAKMGQIPETPSKGEVKQSAAPTTKWVSGDTANKAPKVAVEAEKTAFLNSMERAANKAELKALKDDVAELKEAMKKVDKESAESKKLGLSLFWAEEKLNMFIEGNDSRK